MDTIKIYLIIALSLYSLNTMARVFYQQNYDSGTMPPVGTGDPVWSLPSLFGTMVYGKGNDFFITSAVAHSGYYSLEFTYKGRNGICNTCGFYWATQKAGNNNVGYFVSSIGEDLTRLENKKTRKMNDGPAARPGRLVYNVSNGFSIWKIQSIKNQNAAKDKLILKFQKQGFNGKPPIFNGGDRVVIARQCGVDGTIAGIKNRRNDCDENIIWFNNVTPQPPGSSIFRREYLRADIISSKIHQKLHYTVTGNRTDGNLQSIVLFADKNNLADILQPLLAGFGVKNTTARPKRNYGGLSLYWPGHGLPQTIQFKPGIWYYIEEEFKAQSAPGKNDGAYRLWFSEAGKESTDAAKPILELTNIPLPPIDPSSRQHTVSFWGNTQHITDARGSWYIDDVKISNVKNGAVPQTAVNSLTVPMAPSHLQFQ